FLLLLLDFLGVVILRLAAGDFCVRVHVDGDQVFGFHGGGFCHRGGDPGTLRTASPSLAPARPPPAPGAAGRPQRDCRLAITASSTCISVSSTRRSERSCSSWITYISAMERISATKVELKATPRPVVTGPVSPRSAVWAPASA